MSIQSKRYCFTLNNYKAEERSPPRWIKDITTGGVWGREIGETGTPHIQGFMDLLEETTIVGVRKHFPEGFSMHLEACRGNAQQNITYCTKGGDYETWGVLPTDTKRKHENSEREDLGQAYKLIKEGREEEIQPYIRLKYAARIDRLRSKVKRVVPDLEAPCGVWIWGPTGAGKSTLARTLGAPIFDKPHGPWWDRYNGEDIVVLENVHRSHARGLLTNLKLWAGSTPFIGKVKGSSTGVIRPKKFIVTSPYSIEQVFPDRDAHIAMARLFHVIHMPNKWEPPVLEEEECEAFSS